MKEPRDLDLFGEDASADASASDSAAEQSAKAAIVLPEALDPSVSAFAYTLSPPADNPLATEQVATLAAWRELLVAQGLMNLTSSFEMAQAFGCLSVREPESAVAFSTTQPGGDATLSRSQLLRISTYNLERSWVEAEGTEPPGVDLLLHAALYAADPRIRWVFQVRCDAIVAELEALKLPAVADLDPEAPSPAWARLTHLLHQQQSRPLLCHVPGRPASIFACATDARDAGGLLLVYLARALELRYRRQLA